MRRESIRLRTLPYRCQRNLCSSAARPKRESGAGILNLHRGPAGDGQVVGELSRYHGGDAFTHASVESTGVYWIPLYDVLEQHGVKPCLVDAHGMKTVPGRR